MSNIVYKGYVKVKSYNIIIVLLCIGHFVVPFVFWPWAPVVFEIPRVIFIKYWIECIVLVAAWKAIREGAPNQPDKWLLYPLIAFISIATFSSFVGTDLSKSYWGNYYRQDGLLTLFHLMSFFLVLNLFWRKNWFGLLFTTLAASSLLTSLWSLILGIRLYILNDKTTPNWAGGIGGFFSQPNFLTGYLLITMPVFFYFFVEAKNKTIKNLSIVALIIQSIAIILTLAWMGIIGLAVLALIAVIVFSKNSKIKLLSVAVTACAIIAILFFYNQSLATKGYSAESRPRIYTKIVLGSLKRPIFGWGWANVDHTFEAVDYPIKYTNDIYVDKAHFELLEVLATTGFVGLSIYVTILTILVVKLIKIQKNEGTAAKILLVIVLMYMFHSQTNIMSIAEELIFWLILGIVSASPPKKSDFLTHYAHDSTNIS